MLIDTHAHLNWESYKQDFDSVVQRAFDAGITTVINIGTDIETSKQVVDLESDKLQFFSTIGIHPHEASVLITDESIHNYMRDLEKIYHTNTSKIVAIGECGLDYHFQNNPGYLPSSISEDEIKENQMKLYKAQVELAEKLHLPLVIHCRPSTSSGYKDAWDDIFVPNLEGITGLFHNFTGSEEDAKKALDLGYYLSFSCIVTYPKNEHLRQLLKTLPLDRILTETDCPFLPPQFMRGQRNEPSYVKEVIKVISEVKDISFEEAAKITFENAQRLFSFSLKK